MSRAQSNGVYSRSRISFDRLGCVIAFLIVVAVSFAPFVLYRANRIVAGEGLAIFASLPIVAGSCLLVVALAVAAVAVAVQRPSLRLTASTLGLLVVFPAVGYAAYNVTPADNTFARVSPAWGFWLLSFAFALLFADSLTRLRFGPWDRLVTLAIAATCIGILLLSGSWDSVSILKEYATRSDSFWREAEQHVLLAVGSLAAAACVGLPVGALCHRIPSAKNTVLQILNTVQTIPSIALFGMLMAPLGYLAANVPLAAALGLRGIGAAPALVALFLYALLPVVANTVVGLEQVPAKVVDAARGMGLSRMQRLFQVEFPLALPIILTGIRIVLVQNLGLATVAALIGGGGFGVFVFQGAGQTALDLVLLGAIPTVLLAFAAAVILDAVIELTKGARA